MWAEQIISLGISSWMLGSREAGKQNEDSKSGVMMSATTWFSRSEVVGRREAFTACEMA